MGIEEIINEKIPENMRKKVYRDDFHKFIDHFRKQLANFIPDISLGYRMKKSILNFGSIGDNCIIRNGIQYRYGQNIYLRDNVFINYNCLLLDSEIIFLDKNVSLGPGVHIYTIDHKRKDSRSLVSSKSPIYIGKNVWIGGNSTILPGVSVGENSIVRAGSIVNKNIEPNSLYVGVPVKKIKSFL
jgi:maltose O-acetyltransferase